MKHRLTRLQAFTIVELLVIIAIVAVLVAMQLPVLANTKAKVQRVNCSGNLKRVGIAFRTWAENKNGRMPMQVPASQGGAASAVGFRAVGATFTANMPVTGPLGVFGMFCVMSNELATPRILYCPSDSRANYFQGTIFGNTSGTNAGYFSDSQVSYAIGVDAADITPNMILTADANLGDGATPPTAANTYGDSSSTRKFIALGTNNNWFVAAPGWANNTHGLQGNVGFADGSVQNLGTPALRNALNNSGDVDRPSANNFVKANGFRLDQHESPAVSVNHQMTVKSGNSARHAFTLVELLVATAIIVVLVAIQIPALANTKSKVQRIHCSDNLKRISVAFVTWSGSHADRMPMSMSSSQGGAAMAVGVRATGLTFASNMSPTVKGVFGMFCVMSNELTTPKILCCPADSRVGYSQGAFFGDTTNSLPGFYSDLQASYAIGVDAYFVAPNMFLTSDANLGDGGNPPFGNNVYGEAASIKKFVALGTNISWSSTSPGWANSTHYLQGNVALTDGSVQNFTTTTLRTALNKTGDSGRSAGVFVQATGSSGSGMNRLQFP